MTSKKQFLMIIGLLTLVFIFMGSASAANYTISDVEQGATGVKTYTENNGDIPGFVDVSDKNSTTPSFLYTLTKATVNLNSGNSNPVTINSVGNPTGPSGTGSGTVYKSEYITIANNINSFISSNGRAPNYASSSQGNIRYESLVYMYANIIDFYRDNNRLPNYVVVSNIAGIDSTGVVIDTIAPTVTNNLASGSYNTLKTVTLTANDHVDPNPRIYYSTNNGATWSNQLKTVTINLQPGTTNLKYYARDATSHTSATKTATYTIYPITNLNTGKSYFQIQDAINDTETLNNHTIQILPGVYVENILINKQLTLKSYTSGTVTLHAAYETSPVITINSEGSGSVIQGLNITGAWDHTSAIIIGSANNCTLTENNIMDNFIGISVYSSNNTKINGNTVNNHEICGINIQSSNNTKITSNTLNSDWQGISIESSIKTTISGNGVFYSHLYGIGIFSSNNNLLFGNIIKNNDLNGITLSNSVANVNFNVISGNGQYGLYNEGNGTVDVTNNRWNSSYSPIVSSNTPSDIYIDSGNVSYSPNNGFEVFDVAYAAVNLKTCIEINHRLPSTIYIAEVPVNMPQFLKIAANTILKINGSSISAVFGEYGSALIPVESMTSGIINSTEYLNISNCTNNYMNVNGTAPNYISSSLGSVRSESLIYMYAQILNSYYINEELPEFVIVDPWTVVTNASAVFLSVDQIVNASGTVQSYIENNHQLPNNITIAGKTVNMASFLKLSVTAILNIAGNSDASIILRNYDTTSNPTENITISKNLDQIGYLEYASNVKAYMDVFGKSPNSTTTNFGKMRFESLVYMYSQILGYYNSTGYLPSNITVNPWTIVSNTTTTFFTDEQINYGSSILKSYIETNHQLPNNITIAGKQITMPQFLQLATEEVLNMTGSLSSSFILRTYGAATSPSENITTGNINYTEFIDIANRANSYMNANRTAPNYINSSLGNIRYESLVYMYAQILSSYQANNETIPYQITVNPWSVVSNSSTVFLSMDSVINASGSIQSFIENNYQLPNNITIAGKQITMPQFLHISTTTLLNMEYYNLNASILLKDIGDANNSTEDIVSGDIEYDEYDAIALFIKNSMELNGTAPNYAYQTSLGTHMGFSSLVYMYSQILNFYATNNSTLPSIVTVTPWIAVSNPNAIYNYQTLKVFNSIQAAIDDNETQGIHTIGIGIENISENVIVNKTVVITSVPSVNVTVQALNPDLPVFTINTYGSGSTIQDLIIKGSNLAGIYINNSFYNTISGDIISNNYNGVCIENSTDNQIADSLISNNTGNGILLRTGSDENNIAGNNIINNTIDGISISESIENLISNNMILNNSRDGIHFYNASGNVNFNRIAGNSRYGVNNEGNGTVDATNNWWGSNNPNVSSNDVNGENITYDPWLVLNVISSCDRTNCTGATYNYIVTADLTHNNHGEDTSNGNSPSNKNYPDKLPDEVPVNFNTTFGTIAGLSTTRNGKSVAILNSTSAGLADILVSLDNQNVTLQVNIDSVNVLGIYNSRTGEGFRTIQDAINSNNTLDGDNILLADGTYTENVVVFKTLHIMPVPGANVTVQAANPDYGVFTITGTGSSIHNLTITGSAGSYGIMGYANNLQITGNTITANSGGISLFNSNNSQIAGNNININWYGIVLYNSHGVNIENNNIVDNWYAMTLSESNNSIISGNNIMDNWYGIFVNIANNTNIDNNNITKNNIAISLFNSSSTNITTNNVTNNQAGISHYQSNNTIFGNDITNNAIVNIQEVDTTSVVMQSNIWNCGPASLTTVLNRMGINATQEDIADLAGTDNEGTSMYGLVYAAQKYGMLNSTGMIVPVDQLQPNNIVLLTMAGLYHFSVITNITNETVFLADSAFGNINMSIENFTAMYSGYCVIITNTTINTTNCTLITDMQSIKGTSWAYAGSLIAASCAFGPEAVLVVVAAIAIYYAVDYAIKYYNTHKSTSKSTQKTSKPVKLSPGYKYTKKYTKTKTTTNKYSKLGSGYVSPTKGYTPTPVVNPADVAYQKTFGQYEDKRISEFDKISEIINTAKLTSDEYEKRVSDYNINLNTGSSGGDKRKPDDKRWKEVMENLIDNGKKLKDAIKKQDVTKIIVHGAIVGGGITLITAALTNAVGTKLLKDTLTSLTFEIKKKEITIYVP